MSMRVPPHNEDAERSVLGAAMISHEAMMNAVEMLRPEDFYNRINKEIYEAIEELYKKTALWIQSPFQRNSKEEAHLKWQEAEAT